MAFGIVVIASLLGTGDVGGEVLGACRSSTSAWPSRPASASCSRRSRSTASRPANAARSTAGRRRRGWPIGVRRGSPGCVVVVVAALSSPRCSAPSDFPSWRIDLGSCGRVGRSTGCNDNLRKGVPVIGGTGRSATSWSRDVLDPIREFLQSAAVVAGRRCSSSLLGWVSKGWRLARCCRGLVAASGIVRRHDDRSGTWPWTPSARCWSPSSSASASPCRSASGPAGRDWLETAAASVPRHRPGAAAVRLPRPGGVPVQRRPHRPA